MIYTLEAKNTVRLQRYFMWLYLELEHLTKFQHQVCWSMFKFCQFDELSKHTSIQRTLVIAKVFVSKDFAIKSNFAKKKSICTRLKHE